MSINYPTLAHYRHFSSLFTHFPSTPVENIRQINPFYAKQTQFYAFFTGKRRFHQKTKPIQTQFKPNKAKNKPNLTQNKPNSKPICRKGKNERFCVDKEPYDCFNNATRGCYHPKGCQFKPNSTNLTTIYPTDILNSLSLMRNNIKIDKRIIS
jgi:hypothetical protein